MLWRAPRAAGFAALGENLTGDVNPSGRIADACRRDLTRPNWNNFGAFQYDNVSEFEAESSAACARRSSSTTWKAYTGYRFYETAAAEGLIDYDATVTYPFGYGLSYTTFSQQMGDVPTLKRGLVRRDQDQRRRYGRQGRIEVYYNPPYINGGIEKATANLVGLTR